MSATFVKGRNVSVPRYRLTVEGYRQMAEAGILGEDDRVELIDGELIQMPPIGAKHAEVVDDVNDVFSHQVGAVTPMHVSDVSLALSCFRESRKIENLRLACEGRA